jgi:hypothetical protein
LKSFQTRNSQAVETKICLNESKLFYTGLRRTNSKTMASQNSNEIDEIVKSLKENPGFKAYLVLTLDGIVLRWDQEGEAMPYEKAVQYSHHVMDLFDKSKCHISELFEGGGEDDDEIENMRVHTNEYELIASQQGNYYLVVLYNGGKPKEKINDDAKEEAN